MPIKHFIKETLDSGHLYGNHREHTFMTLCGQRKTQKLDKYYGGLMEGPKGTRDATRVTCEGCLMDKWVKKVIADALIRRIKGENKEWYAGEGRWESNG